MNWKNEFIKRYKIGEMLDSQIKDFEVEHDLEPGEAFNLLSIIKAKGTKCEGCRNVGFLPCFYPCNHCINNPGFQNKYEID